VLVELKRCAEAPANNANPKAAALRGDGKKQGRNKCAARKVHDDDDKLFRDVSGPVGIYRV